MSFLFLVCFVLPALFGMDIHMYVLDFLLWTLSLSILVLYSPLVAFCPLTSLSTRIEWPQ